MAIDLNTMYIQNAHRLSLYDLHPDIRKPVNSSTGLPNDIQAGQLFHLEEGPEGIVWNYADGSKKAYPTLNSRFGTIASYDDVQHQYTEGRDDVTRAGKITVLKGNFEIGTDQYDDSETYAPGDALKATTGGILTKWVDGTDSPAIIVGYVTVPPHFEQPNVTHGMRTYARPVKPFLRYEG